MPRLVAAVVLALVATAPARAQQRPQEAQPVCAIERYLAEELGDRYGGLFVRERRYQVPMVAGASEEAARRAIDRCGWGAETDLVPADFTWAQITAAHRRVRDAVADLSSAGGTVWGIGIGIADRRFRIGVSIDQEASAESEQEVRRRADEAARGVPVAIERGARPTAGPRPGTPPFIAVRDRTHALAFGRLRREYACTEIEGVANGVASIVLRVASAAARPEAERVLAEAGVQRGRVEVVSPRLRFGTLAAVRRGLAARAPRGVQVRPSVACGPVTLAVPFSADARVRRWGRAEQRRYGRDRVLVTGA